MVWTTIRINQDFGREHRLMVFDNSEGNQENVWIVFRQKSMKQPRILDGLDNNKKANQNFEETFEWLTTAKKSNQSRNYPNFGWF